MKARARERFFEAIFARDGGCCTYCGIRVERRGKGLHGAAHLATLDHVQPRCEGGALSAANIVLACQACNNARGTMEVAAFRALKASSRGQR